MSNIFFEKFKFEKCYVRNSRENIKKLVLILVDFETGIC